MNANDLEKIIERIPSLHLKYRGTFSANHIPPLSRNKFCIVNTDNYGQPGKHWIMLANKDGRLYFGDPLGRRMNYYKNFLYFASKHEISHLVDGCIQSKLPYCGWYAIYLAWSLFNEQKQVKRVRDYHVKRFISQF